jgi:hypothetical protein
MKDIMCNKMLCHLIESRTKVATKLGKEEQLWWWRWMGGGCLLRSMRLVANINNLRQLWMETLAISNCNQSNLHLDLDWTIRIMVKLYKKKLSDFTKGGQNNPLGYCHLVKFRQIKNTGSTCQNIWDNWIDRDIYLSWEALVRMGAPSWISNVTRSMLQSRATLVAQQ